MFYRLQNRQCLVYSAFGKNLLLLVHPKKYSNLRHPLKMSVNKQIYYSDKYYDDKYEYRHVVLPKEMVKLVPKNRLMAEMEWRSLGVQQSPGWVHYMTHQPEPHILLFKRPITTPPVKQ